MLRLNIYSAATFSKPVNLQPLTNFTGKFPVVYFQSSEKQHTKKIL